MAEQEKERPKKPRVPVPSEAEETRLLVEYAFDMAKKLGVRNVFVRADRIVDRRLVERFRSDQVIFWLIEAGSAIDASQEVSSDIHVAIPRSAVGGGREITVGLTAAVLQQKLRPDETAICLTGAAGSTRLDFLLVVNPARDLPWFRNHEMSLASARIGSEEGIRLLDIALKFASEGREGKPIGTIFLLGNPRLLKKHTRPMILNPLAGHPARTRNIHNPDFLETLRELSAIDGAFVINTRGVVQQAGVYLSAPVTDETSVPKGVGSRHVAAAAISAATNCVTFVISESSGRVTVFAEGAAILELDGRS